VLKAAKLARAQRGVSLIEMMVGITIGMIIVAGAVTLSVTQLNEHRRLMLETQIQQDLRAAADLILRDARRAGYWSKPQNGAWTPANPTPMANAYSATTPASAASGASFEYGYSVVTLASPEDNISAANERFGFRLSGGELQFKLGEGNWQPLTDRGVMTVTEFRTDFLTQPVSLEEFCPKPCDGTTLCPQQSIRYLSVRIVAEAKHDKKVVRSVDLRTRLRNDELSGACPV
jgi:prepilin peptidase dependent protein B